MKATRNISLAARPSRLTVLRMLNCNQVQLPSFPRSGREGRAAQRTRGESTPADIGANAPDSYRETLMSAGVDSPGHSYARPPSLRLRRKEGSCNLISKAISLSLTIAIMLLSFFKADAQTAKEIVTKAENNVHGLSSVTEMTIQIKRPTWTRTMTMKGWTKGDQYSMIVVTAPAKDAGTVFLKRVKEIWNWLPNIERVVKLPPSMMSQSWMGTDMTNDDLVKASSRIDDYKHKILGDSVIEGRKCWKIEMIPLPQAAVVWSKVNIWIDQKDYLELRLEFYDEDNKLVNVMQGSNIRTIGGRVMPQKLEMIPVQKKGQETIIIYNSAVFNQAISIDFFTTQNMKTIK